MAILCDNSDGIDVQPALTYLANSITFNGNEVPYSTITAIDFQSEPPLGPFIVSGTLRVPSASGTRSVPDTLRDNEIAINDWAARRLNARVGDQLTVTYYEPESTTGILRERTIKLKLAAILKLEGAAADKRLTPTVRGLTDKETIEDWDLPFQLKPGHIKSEDDRYWKRYGATPKAFVSLTTGRRLWASRFGQTTSIRVRPAAGMTAASLAARLDLDPQSQGFVFRPVKEAGPQSRRRHDSLWRAVSGIQLLRHRRGGDARAALVSSGHRAASEASWPAAGAWLSAAASQTALDDGRSCRGGRRKPRGNAGRSRLCGAHAAGAADLVAAGDRHAVSRPAHNLGKSRHRLRQRAGFGFPCDLVCGAADQPSGAAAAAGG